MIVNENSLLVDCPDKAPYLLHWNPGHHENKKVKIGRGMFLKLESSASLHSIVIENGGKFNLINVFHTCKQFPNQTVFLLRGSVLCVVGEVRAVTFLTE